MLFYIMQLNLLYFIFIIHRDDKTILTNTQVGHMLRSKLSSANEGGVAAGSGALDSPYLVL